MFHHLNLKFLWIASRVGNKYRYILTHSIATRLGDAKSQALLIFHAFTDCDQVSFSEHFLCVKRADPNIWIVEQSRHLFYKLSDMKQVSDWAFHGPSALSLIYSFSSHWGKKVSIHYNWEHPSDWWCPTTTLKTSSIYDILCVGEFFGSATDQTISCRIGVDSHILIMNGGQSGWQSQRYQQCVTTHQLIKCSCNPQKGYHRACKCRKN